MAVNKSNGKFSFKCVDELRISTRLTSSRDEKWLKSVSSDFAELLQNKSKFEDARQAVRADGAFLHAIGRLSGTASDCRCPSDSPQA